jgi:hypothetical protein
MSGFVSWEMQEIFIFSEAYLASYQMGTENSFSCGKTVEA